ncbi:MAG: hypothetical protein AAF772_16675, partial [Acidobacteriota bacterium]
MTSERATTSDGSPATAPPPAAIGCPYAHLHASPGTASENGDRAHAADAHAADAASPAATHSAIPGPRAPRPFGWPQAALAFHGNPIRTMRTLRARYGDVVRLCLRKHPTLFFQPAEADCGTIFAFGADNLRHVLTKPTIFQSRAPRGPNTATYRRLTTSLLFANGDVHRRGRMIMRQGLNGDRIERYHDVMVRFADEL